MKKTVPRAQEVLARQQQKIGAWDGDWVGLLGIEDDPSLKLGVLLSVCLSGNCQCYTLFDSLRQFERNSRQFETI